jgi:hypothetical protein
MDRQEISAFAFSVIRTVKATVRIAARPVVIVGTA